MSDRLVPPALPSAAAERGPRWHRSSRSTGMNNCVEAARLGVALLAVRDSKDVAKPPLRFSAGVWRAFVAGLLRERVS
ncbi:hypothetical protein EES43_02405 [Streptomyces sp. ADI96-02]|uniref:DUF397 domain-containing protein n=1 Tax=unclassified Streptomyces TaxID=2593676 RepID=UPI000F555669|nr:DUF397 domain-containing protein [Streptomyces sp. ADI96-02]RPK67912.1 hypothetical protein EES43_02405 [Streptomyces sp. ADI96-02]